MINLGDKNWGVKDSGLLAYKQVGSKYFNKDFDFTRASNGTYVDKNGVLQTAELYNLINYSQDLNSNTLSRGSVSNEDILSPFSNNEKSLFIPDTLNNFHYPRFSASTRSGFVHTISVFLKSDGSDAFNFVLVNISFGNSDGNAGVIFNIKDAEKVGFFTHDYDVQIDDFGNGWHRYSFQFTTSATSVSVDCNVLPSNSATSYSGNGINGVYIYGAQLVEGTEPLDYQYTNGRVGIPRIDFSDGVGALLLEPQRSNLLLQSNSFDTTWGNVLASVTGGQEGIFGTNDALLLTLNNSTSARIQQSITTTIGQEYTFSFYAKVDSGSVEIRAMAGGGYETKTITSEWQRFQVNWVATATTGYGMIRNNEDIEKTIYIQHAQYELGSYPTSIIETTTSAVTRIADVANNCGSEQDFNSEEGVLYAEINTNTDATDKALSINDGTSNNRIWVGYSTSIKRIYALGYSSGVLQFVLFKLLLDESQFIKVACKYKENDFALWVDGVEVATDTSGLTPIALSNIHFDIGNNGGKFYGNAKQILYFPTALTDEELADLTTI